MNLIFTHSKGEWRFNSYIPDEILEHEKSYLDDNGIDYKIIKTNKFDLDQTVSVYFCVAGTRHGKVKVAVVVVIAHGAADTAFIDGALGTGQPECRCDVGERGDVIAPQRISRSGLVGQEQVQIPIIVDVEPAGADGGPCVG